MVQANFVPMVPVVSQFVPMVPVEFPRTGDQLAAPAHFGLVLLVLAKVLVGANEGTGAEFVRLAPVKHCPSAKSTAT